MRSQITADQWVPLGFARIQSPWTNDAFEGVHNDLFPDLGHLWWRRSGSVSAAGRPSLLRAGVEPASGAVGPGPHRLVEPVPETLQAVDRGSAQVEGIVARVGGPAYDRETLPLEGGAGSPGVQGRCDHSQAAPPALPGQSGGR